MYIDELLEDYNVEIPNLEPQFIRDINCTKDTPVKNGVNVEQMYGVNKVIYPRYMGRQDTEHFRSIYLDHLLPLEEYDKIIVNFSGGKDSLACILYLYKLCGNDSNALSDLKSKLELWHHDIDGQNPMRTMDWPVTQNYVKAFADHEEIPLRVSYRKNGFFGELYRIGASELCYWIDPDTEEVYECKPSKKYLQCKAIKESAIDDVEKELKKYGYRYKFPAKCGDLSSRWCSAYLKIMVEDSVITNLDSIDQLVSVGGKRGKFPAKGTTHQGRWCSGALKASVNDSVISNLDKTSEDCKILIISGERRGESAGRSKYNEIEIHRTSAPSKRHRIVHQWRPVIDWHEGEVWNIIKEFKINPHSCYRIGWNRCSCMCCIFSTPSFFAGVRELFPKVYESLKNDEIILGFTLDNKCDLDTFVGDAKSCVNRKDKKALEQILTGNFSVDDIIVKGEWKLPCGAFHGAEGGPC